MQTRRKYILLETLISIIINVALSIAFVELIFHGQSRVAVSGAHGIVLDMAPQTFMVTLMGTLVPTLLTRRRLRARAFSWSQTTSPQSGNPFVAALTTALIASCFVVAISWILLPRLIPNGLNFCTLLMSKAVFGGVLALIVTPRAITKALR